MRIIIGFDDEYSKALGGTLLLIVCIFILLIYTVDRFTDDAVSDDCHTDGAIIRLCMEDASRLCLSKGMILSDIDVDDAGVFAVCVSDYEVERYMVYCGKGIGDVYGA